MRVVGCGWIYPPWRGWGDCPAVPYTPRRLAAFLSLPFEAYISETQVRRGRQPSQPVPRSFHAAPAAVISKALFCPRSPPREVRGDPLQSPGRRQKGRTAGSAGSAASPSDSPPPFLPWAPAPVFPPSPSLPGSPPRKAGREAKPAAPVLSVCNDINNLPPASFQRRGAQPPLRARDLGRLTLSHAFCPLSAGRWATPSPTAPTGYLHNDWNNRPSDGKMRPREPKGELPDE